MNVLATGAAAAPGLAAPTCVTLQPGELCVLGRGDSVDILLGSCVAIVLTDPRRTLAGACHVVHVGVRHIGPGLPTAHGPTALAALFASLRARAIEPMRCHAWVAGGGHMFPQRLLERPDELHPGHLNSHWALQALSALGIPVLGHHLGGTAYRRLRWTVGPGTPSVDATDITG